MTEPPTQAKSVSSGAQQLLIDLGPIAVFVIAFNVLQRIEATRESAVYIATDIFMATTLAAIAYSRIKHGRVPSVLIITGVLVVGFGGLTLLLRDRTFIQIKPTITYLFYTAAILGSVAIRQNVWKLLFGHAFTLPDRIWTILALRWAGFFLWRCSTKSSATRSRSSSGSIGRYITGDVTGEYLDRLENQRNGAEPMAPSLPTRQLHLNLSANS